MEIVRQFQSKLKYIYVMLLATIVILSIQSNIVYADTNVIVEADYADGFSYTSSGGGEWYFTYYKGKGYKGQGVLVYLLERDGGGAVAGVTPKAFPCSTDVKRIELNAQDKYKNYSAVTTWESSYVPWASIGSNTVSKNGAIMYDSLHSNVADIKTWLLTKTSTTGGEESTQGIDLVQNLWGEDIAQRFADNEIVFIAEPIVAIQYSQSASTGFLENLKSLTFNLGSSTLPSAGAYKNNSLRAKSYIDAFLAQVEVCSDTTGLSSDLRDKLSELEAGIEYAIGENETDMDGVVIDTIPVTEQLNRLISLWSVIGRFRTSELTGDRVYKTLGEPIVGTPASLVEHYNGLEVNPVYSGSAANSGVALPTSIAFEVSELGGSWYRRSANSHTFIRASRGEQSCLMVQT